MNESEVIMSGTSAYDSYLDYATVFSEIVELLNASGINSTVKENYDKTGLVVEVALPDRTAILSDGERDNWSLQRSDQIIELDIPVQNRDAKAITTALLKAIGK